ncbi:MFS transporter [Myceligenerans pegani]|uniref:MFS transporter n=1 Tax=Myceligenerans pegani TaxID=2776917 RepID=A0ABR9N0S5_9MICO|nr:MFS transporter [Myceligenerans sp. TRM 65318]MBE1877260.1 MFS transporter [Myceligenerans sp. TRM 65318]MBE3019531.1 MFS transporter [Myceligenerans sp. TRM 65318]
MSDRRSSAGGRSPAAIVLGVLFTGTFVMGCAEMLVAGMLDLMSADLAVPLSAVGALVSANAIGIALGGPLLTFVTARLDRRPVLLAALAVFTGLNLLPALGAGLETFIAARVVIGAVEGLFIAAAITTATSIVPRERVGRAMAVVISGFAVSGAVGMPLGRLLGEAVGWRVSFLALVLAATTALLVALLAVPRVPAEAEVRMLGQLRFALHPRVLAVLAVGVLLFAGTSAAQTYLVPFLGTVAGISGPWVGVCLMGFGIAAAIGSFAGGRFADTGAPRALALGTLAVAASLTLLVLWGANPVVAVVALLGLGMCGAGITSPWQHRVEHLAGPGAILAASLPASAGNLGDAIGAFAGGQAVDIGDVPAAIVVAATLATASIAAAIASRSLRPVHSSHAAEPQEPRPEPATAP